MATSPSNAASTLDYYSNGLTQQETDFDGSRTAYEYRRDSMKFTSENEIVNQHHIGYRSLGFGEPTDLKTKQYELIIDFNELPSSFIEHANTFIQQCRLDDTEQGFPDIQELQTLQYPELYELTKKSPALSASIIKDYLYFDLLFALFPRAENLKLVINNIASIQASDTTLKITGETFPFK